VYPIAPPHTLRTDDQIVGHYRRAAHDLFDAHLPLLRDEQQPGVGLSVRKYLLHRRGLLTRPALRAPKASLTAAAQAEVEQLLRRLARHDPRARL
jgi:4-hydroxy-tetrahydrodipicolinate synthase